MTAPALSVRDRRVPAAALFAPPRHPMRSRPWTAPRFLVAAVAALAAAEIVVDRSGDALTSLLAPSQQGWARILELVGSGVVGAGATLVVAAALMLGFEKRWTARLLAAGAVLVIVATAFPTTVTRSGLHAVVILGVATLAATPRRRGLMHVAVLVAAAAVALGQASFLVPAWGDMAGVRLGAEAGLVLAPLLAAAGSAGAGSWRARSVAAIAAAVTGGVLLARPEFAAPLATWTVGATLSLPLPLYVAAAAATGFLIGGALEDERLRPIAAGVLLLLAAGTAPTALHHNLGGWLGVFLIARPFAIQTAGAMAEKREVECRS